METYTNSKDYIKQITVEKLDAIIAENKHTIVDVRDANSIFLQGSIPNAINIPFDAINGAVDRNHEEYNSIFDHNGPFLFACTGGVMSYTAAIKAKRSGVKIVFNLDGGHSGWLKHKAALVES